MPTSFRTAFYDPDLVIVTFNGIILDGFADGEFVTVEMMSDAFGDVVGTDGEVVRSKSNDRRGKAVVKLLQSSLSNDALSAIHNIDLNAPNGAGVGAFQVQDFSGTTLVQGFPSWIVKFPDQSEDRTAKSRDWEFRIAHVNNFVGSNLGIPV